MPRFDLGKIRQELMAKKFLNHFQRVRARTLSALQIAAKDFLYHFQPVQDLLFVSMEYLNVQAFAADFFSHFKTFWMKFLSTFRCLWILFRWLHSQFAKMCSILQ